MGLALEAFDDGAADAAPGPSPDWAAGHAEGLAEGRLLGAAEAEAAAGHLSRELAQSLDDAAFAYAEARGQVLAALEPLFRLLVDRLLPAVAAQAVGPWIAEAVAEAARADTAEPLRIDVHPSRLATVRACLPPGMPATLRADPALGLNAARLSAAAGESALDLDACLQPLAEALEAFLDPSERKARHG